MISEIVKALKDENKCVFSNLYGVGTTLDVYCSCKNFKRINISSDCENCEQHFSLEAARNHVTPIEQEGD